jgi:hypothetical protein
MTCPIVFHVWCSGCAVCGCQSPRLGTWRWGWWWARARGRPRRSSQCGALGVGRMRAARASRPNGQAPALPGDAIPCRSPPRSCARADLVTSETLPRAAPDWLLPGHRSRTALAGWVTDKRTGTFTCMTGRSARPTGPRRGLKHKAPRLAMNTVWLVRDGILRALFLSAGAYAMAVVEMAAGSLEVAGAAGRPGGGTFEVMRLRMDADDSEAGTAGAPDRPAGGGEGGAPLSRSTSAAPLETGSAADGDSAVPSASVRYGWGGLKGGPSAHLGLAWRWATPAQLLRSHGPRCRPGRPFNLELRLSRAAVLLRTSLGRPLLELDVRDARLGHGSQVRRAWPSCSGRHGGGACCHIGRLCSVRNVLRRPAPAPQSPSLSRAFAFLSLSVWTYSSSLGCWEPLLEPWQVRHGQPDSGRYFGTGAAYPLKARRIAVGLWRRYARASAWLRPTLPQVLAHWDNNTAARPRSGVQPGTWLRLTSTQVRSGAGVAAVCSRQLDGHRSRSAPHRP